MTKDDFRKNCKTKIQQSIKPDYMVYKTNPLLMVRDEMAIMQARFFTAYLCKVNPGDPDTYKARFSLSEFCKTLEVDASNIKKLKADCSAIRRMGFDFIEYRRRHGEKIDPMLMDEVSLFSRFSISGNYEDGYFVEVTPTEEMKGLLSDQAHYGYVSYEARNTLVLSTKRHMRMYEFLKRSEGRGISVDIPTLKAYLGLTEDDYPEMKVFRRNVINRGLKEINAKTDIFVECEPKTRGRGGKIVGFHFSVKQNPSIDFKDEDKPKPAPKRERPIVLSDADIEDFNTDESKELSTEERNRKERIEFFRTALRDEGKSMTDEQIDELQMAARKSEFANTIHVANVRDYDLALHEYIQAQDRYTRSNLRNKNSYRTFLLGSVKNNWANFGA